MSYVKIARDTIRNSRIAIVRQLSDGALDSLRQFSGLRADENSPPSIPQSSSPPRATANGQTNTNNMHNNNDEIQETFSAAGIEN
jgi:hypothetical protein